MSWYAPAIRPEEPTAHAPSTHSENHFGCRTGRSDQQDDGHTHPDGRHPPKRYWRPTITATPTTNGQRLLKSLTDTESRRKEVTQEAETLSSLVMTLSSTKHSAAQGMQLTRDAATDRKIELMKLGWRRVIKRNASESGSHQLRNQKNGNYIVIRIKQHNGCAGYHLLHTLKKSI